MTNTFVPSPMLQVVREAIVNTQSGQSFKAYRIKVRGDTLLASTEHGILIAHDTPPKVIKKVSNVWIPLSVVRTALPHMVQVDDIVSFYF